MQHLLRGRPITMTYWWKKAAHAAGMQPWGVVRNRGEEEALPIRRHLPPWQPATAACRGPLVGKFDGGVDGVLEAMQQGEVQ
jgi:hypothetical protein